MNQNLLDGEGYALERSTVSNQPSASTQPNTNAQKHITKKSKRINAPASAGDRAVADMALTQARDTLGTGSGIARRSSERNALHSEQPRSAVEAESKQGRSCPEAAPKLSRSGVEQPSKSSRRVVEEHSKKNRLIADSRQLTAGKNHVCSHLRRPQPHPGRGLAFGVLLLLLLIAGFSRGQSMRPLSVGDTLPADIVLHKLVNGTSDNSTSVGEYRGKWLILDFWATYCPACLNAMPKLWDIQQKFGQKLAVLLVSSEPSGRVQRQLERLPVAQDTDFPVVVEDTRLHGLFPHRIIPHEVWVDPDGIVRAITDHTQLTTENVSGMLAGTISDLPLKRDRTDWYQAQRYDEVTADRFIRSQSTLRRYDPGMPTTGYYARDTLNDVVKYRHVSFYNQPLLYMYYSVFMRCEIGRPAGNLNPYRIAVEINDPQLRRRYANADLKVPFYPTEFPYAGWGNKRQYREASLFSYDLTLPDFVLDTVFMRQVFADLGRQFPVKARVEKRLMDVLVITVADAARAGVSLQPEDKATAAENGMNKEAITIARGTMDDFMALLSYFRAPLTVDETGIANEIGMRISFKDSPYFNERRGLVANMYPFDVETFRSQLNQYGLEATYKKRLMDMLVITDEIPN